MQLDERELGNIAVSVVAIALSLTFFNQGLDVKSGEFVFWLAAFTITVGSGFVFHELAHKLVAIRYGARAAYEAWPSGLMLMLGLAILPQLFGIRSPFLFLAPGAVMIHAYRINRKQYGLISLAGPVTNVVLAFVFFGLVVGGLMAGFGAESALVKVAMLGVTVNFFLAFFNMLPIFPLDGSKVMAWDWRVWAAFTIFCFGGVLLLGGL
jgi:Zn-dependent protease